MIKKISALFLALVLCLSVMVVPASAAVELGSAQMAFSLEWDKESYSAGETAVLSIYMDAADDLSLYTGSFVIGLNSAVISQDDNSLDDIRANSTIADWFAAYYKEGTTNLSWLAATVSPKVDAANTAEEQALYDHYIKFTAARNSAGSHENVANSKAGFGGDEFIADEPILTLSLVVAADVPDGTVLNAAMTSGSKTCSPVQTTWKYYKNPGSATTTANITAANIDVTQTFATATIGEVEEECTHANTTATEEVTANATCTAAGSKVVTTTCNDCGEVVKTETVAIPATGHTEGTAVKENETAASCTGNGSYDTVVYCTVCNEELSRKTTTVPATGHTEVEIPAVSATCTTPGSTAGVKCSVCDAIITAPQTIEALGHEMTKVVAEAVAPTCTADGATAVMGCTRCDVTEGGAVVPATGHTEVEIPAVPATCTTAGSTAGVKCSVCDTVITAPQTIGALGHTEGAVVVENEVAASCGADGSYDNVVYCTVCNVELSRTPVVVPATGAHVYANVVDEKAATCTADGYIVKECACGARETTPVPATGHTEGAVVVENNVAADCENDGSYDNVVYCTVCNAELSRDTVVVKAAGHNYESVVTAPTCTAAGYTTFTCSVCNDTYTVDGEAALGHDFSEVEAEAVAPTCTADGATAVMGCSRCDATEGGAVVPATGHTEAAAVVENEVAATCTTDGSYDTVVYCSVCNAELSRVPTTVPATGHTEGAVVVENEVAATCGADGSYDNVVYCTVCGTELSRETVVVKATGEHVYADVVDEKAATCTEDGYVTKACGCGATDTTVVPATGHTAAEAVVENEVAATCTADGSYDTVVYCSVCDAELSRVNTVVPAAGHNYESVVTAPTCTAAGYTTFTCSVCNDTYTVEGEGALGHDFSEVEVEAVAPTCTADGATAVMGCSRCDATEGGAVVPATGHTEAAAVVENEVAATCTADGSYDTVVYCSVCDAELSRETTTVPATGHVKTTITTVDPTYTADGYVVETCDACGAEISKTIIPALTLSVKHAGAQISFNKTEAGAYAGSFNVRAVAAIKKADFVAAFGADGAKITDIGFVFAAGSNVTAPSMDDVKAIVENGASVVGYAKKSVTKISSTLVPGHYSFTCLVTEIPDDAKDNSLVAVGYVAWDNDADGVADAYAYYTEAKTISFATLYDKYFPW